MQIVIDVPDNEILIGWYTRSDGVNKYHNAKTLGEPNYTLLDDLAIEQLPSVQPKAKTLCKEFCNECKHFVCTDATCLICDKDHRMYEPKI